MPPEIRRVCRLCGIEKYIAHFPKKKTRRGGHYRQLACSACRYKSAKERNRHDEYNPLKLKTNILGPRFVKLPDECSRCKAFCFVQKVAGKWYPCPNCLGSGLTSVKGTLDPNECVRDNTIGDGSYSRKTKRSIHSRSNEY